MGAASETIAFEAEMERQRSADRELVERFREGDRDAFTALYRVHHPAVFRFAYAMTGDRASAAEVTQDVFVWLIRHAGDFDPRRGDLAAFLGGVARKFLHRRGRDQRRWLPLDEKVRDSGGGADDVERAIDTGALRRAIALLPLRYREAVVLCDLESKSYDEAAAQIGCAVGTVRSRLHRGRELLMRKLSPERKPAGWWS